MHRTIVSNFMDSAKQEAIDMLLVSNAYSGELGQKSRALLSVKDALGTPTSHDVVKTLYPKLQ